VKAFCFSVFPAAASLLLAASGLGQAVDPSPSVAFEWFEYTGHDSVFETPLPPGSFRNPVLAGFYPDPSICRVGEDYYLVNSSFSYFPGVPIFHSRDLVHWEQIGHVLDRPSQLKLDGLGVSRGIFAPALRYHDGLFYMVTTLVDGGGNFYVTARNPAGPWSDPIWLPEVDGIDPSFFFDDDGKAYLINNGPPPDQRPLYEGHRAIWIQEFDLKTQKLVGPRSIIVNGGADLSKRPIWIEGPHLFRRNHDYYLIAAEGGTSENHSEVVFRSHSVNGPYVPASQNPILTQRSLPDDRAHPVTSTGHADFVTTPDGAWWAVFLGCRPYSGQHYNTGRETFMLPVTWTEDGPVILPPDQPVPIIVTAPRLGTASAESIPHSGNFNWRDEFDGRSLKPVWNFLRTPHESGFSLTDKPGALTLHARADSLRENANPAFIGHRQQHANFTVSTALYAPTSEGVSAGLVAFQNETHHYFIGVRKQAAKAEIFLERIGSAKPEIIAHQTLDFKSEIVLKLETKNGRISFSYSTSPDKWEVLRADEDATLLSTKTAGGFVGTYIGLHARLEP